ncbi:MAG: histidine kinase, partial [Bacteroidota bacterium]
VSIVLVTIIAVLSSYTVGLALNTEFALPGFKQTLGFTFRINLFLHCINAIYQYNRELANTKLEAERLKKQSTEAQLEALRNQVNPHFLFNSLNVLISVIEENADLGVKYVGELSKVYRYLLRSEKEHLVDLKDEISFLESYIFLLKIRFQKNLDIKLQLEKVDDQQIPPSTLQLLIENAIKHNEVSKKHPLKITIEQQNGHITIQNSLNPRNEKAESSGVGLKNIRSRYTLLTSVAPIVESSDQYFTVRLPSIDKVSE